MYVAYHSLAHIFPGASISVNKNKPTLWDSLSTSPGPQALIIISPQFMPDDVELHRLLEFAKAGNTVFISSRKLSYDAQNFFNCDDYSSDYTILGRDVESDSLAVGLVAPPFPDSQVYTYPGRQYDGYFGKFDKEISYELGRKNATETDFIRLKAGRGNIFLHLAPLTFSNYFLLHGHNIDYYNRMLSMIPADTRRVVWDEYFLYKRSTSNNRADSKSPLSALLSQRSFRAALSLLILLLVLFIFQEMRRKQRVVPVMPAPRNDSLEFVKTIGRLYHEKRDHKNLSRKMASYFLEYVRNRYKLSTNKLDEEFVLSLHRKTAHPEMGISKIVSFINNIEVTNEITDAQLSDFHKELEAFYKAG